MGFLALVAACSSHAQGPARSASVDGGSESSRGADASGSTGATVGLLGDAGPPDGADSALGSCAASVDRAVPTPVDISFMIDASGSMNDLIAPGQSKWSAMVSALTAFMEDPASSGLGVAVQTFPTTVSSAAPSCSSDQACGQAGPCLLGVCNDADEEACADDGDCQTGITCVPVGVCADDPSILCVSYGAPCGADINGFDLGNCGDPLATSYCANGDSCTASDYAQAPIATLPGAASAIVASLQSRSPAGSAPTQAALQGALDGAEAYAASHPGHTVVTVLATGGAPDETADPSTGLCTQVAATQAGAQQIAQVAAMALAASPSIETFAIGVFAPSDTVAGAPALDLIATSGGSGAPFVISTAAAGGGASVAAQIVDALGQIRAASLPCQFDLPSAAAGGTAFDDLNVSYTAGSGAVTTLAYVETPGACDAGGWYYDSDPAEGGTPTTIDMCPETCATLRGDPEGEVTIVAGCPTVAK